MLKSSFPYLDDGLVFNEKLHTYHHHGIKLISVTGWLGSKKEKFDPYKISSQVSKNPNSEYYQMEPEVIRKLWQQTGVRGTHRHNHVEKWLTGETETCDESKFLIKLGITPETAWSEIPLVSRKLMLAGTADIITEGEDGLTIWDIKTCKKVDTAKIESFTYQILTYATMLSHMTRGKIPIHAGGVISITPVANISEGVNADFNKPTFIPIEEIPEKFTQMIKDRKLECKLLDF